MIKFTLALSAAALALTGTAYAAPGGFGGGFGKGGPSTRAEVTAHAETMFAKLDVNKDGMLDPKDAEARQGERFARLDANGDGSISQEEFAAAKQARGEKGGDKGKRGGKKGHGKMGHGMAKAADTNGDGAVSKAEFTAAALARFDRTDTNRDGTISKEERKAAKQAFKQMRKDGAANRAAQ